MSEIPQNCCASVFYSFKNYVNDMMYDYEDYITLAQKENATGYLGTFIKRLEKGKETCKTNNNFVQAILNQYNEKFSGEEERDKSLNLSCCRHTDKHQVGMVTNILQQSVREWSTFGKDIRSMVFLPIINEIPLHSTILIPGAGLCRLAYELQLIGNYCTVVECNHYMLLTMNTIISSEQNAFTIAPFVANTSDLLHSSAQTVTYQIPDVSPFEIMKSVKYSDMDFESFCSKDLVQYDVVCTCYFIDTSFNIVNYLNGIYSKLKQGGKWINVGPLHWVNDSFSALHLAMNEIIEIATSIGFSLESFKTLPQTEYIPQENTTCPLVYNNVLFVMTKK
ncbi:carnosine N-methyltransferase [Entamoeba marina]